MTALLLGTDTMTPFASIRGSLKSRMISTRTGLWLLLLAVVAVLGLSQPALAQRQSNPDPVKLQIASKGQTQLVITVGSNASKDASVMQLAAWLSNTLHTMTDATFPVSVGAEPRGIAIGLSTDFPGLKLADRFDPTSVIRREEYILRTHSKGVHLIGATPLALQDAVADLLHRAGYRLFFPSKNWEVIPHTPDLSLAVDVFELPDYLSRRIWYGYGMWPELKEQQAEWEIANRHHDGVKLSTGHAYDGIIAHNKAAFEKDPTLFPLVDGVRKGNKLNIPNPDLRKLVVNYALAQFAKKPNMDSISMDPSDGGNWGNVGQDPKTGSISDNVALLANDVAAAVKAKYGDKLVGIYSYNQHAAPPAIKIHPNVVVSVATRFATGGFTLDQRMEGFQKQGATIGVREYYSVNVWDRDLPGRPIGSNIDYLTRTIPHFHKMGARYMSAESSDNWAAAGLGYYIAAQLMWDVSKVKDVSAMTDDFFKRAFGPAEQPMRAYYKLTSPVPSRPLLSEDLVGRMYRALNDAMVKAGDDAPVKSRIGDMVLYTRYVELYRQYSESTGTARQDAYEAMIRFAYRIRGRRLIHSLGLVRDLARRDHSIKLPDDAKFNVPEGENPWKTSEPLVENEIESILKAGVAANSLRDFEAVSFSDDLVPADALKLTGYQPVQDPVISIRGSNRVLYVWADKPGTIEFEVKGGQVYANGKIELNLFAPDQQPTFEPLDQKVVIADQQPHAVVFKTPYAGLHKLVINDHGALTVIAWKPGLRVTQVETPGERTEAYHRSSRYFYVPKGTKVLAGFVTGVGNLYDGDGKLVFTFDKYNGYWSLPIPPGQDGKMWHMKINAGARYWMTVPPYFARTPDELLLPREVVLADQPAAGQRAAEKAADEAQKTFEKKRAQQEEK